MALTKLQRRLCQIVAVRLRESERSYVAGGVALNEALATKRVSRDLDLFHDTAEAVAVSFEQDRAAFEEHGLSVSIVRSMPGYVEALIRDGSDSVLVEWVKDSAFRFFALRPDDEFGLTLHPLDLATNKVCALVGRVEVRDWLDTIACHERLQPLGYLSWAACGKDAGLSPEFILEQAARTARYSREEVAALDFEGELPDFVALSAAWRIALAEAHAIVKALPVAHLGECVLTPAGEPFRGSLAQLSESLSANAVLFHKGRIAGAVPKILISGNARR